MPDVNPNAKRAPISFYISLLNTVSFRDNYSFFFAAGASFDINDRRSPNYKKLRKGDEEKVKENAAQPSWKARGRCGAPAQAKLHSVLFHLEEVPCSHEWAVQGSSQGKKASPSRLH